jgi:hypothetical protein
MRNDEFPIMTPEKSAFRPYRSDVSNVPKDPLDDDDELIYTAISHALSHAHLQNPYPDQSQHHVDHQRINGIGQGEPIVSSRDIAEMQQVELPRRVPVDILRMILNHLNHHGPTLASCMRVSNEFNAITAPILYRSISIGRNTDNLLYSAPGIEGRPRKSVDKGTCLAYVKELEIFAHTEEECPSTIFDPRGIQILRISLPLPDGRHSFDLRSTTDHLAYGGRSCPMASSIHPSKIIIFNTSLENPIHLLDIPQDSLHTLVTVCSYSDTTHNIEGTAIRPFKGSSSMARQAIYVLRCHDPLSSVETGPRLKDGEKEKTVPRRMKCRRGMPPAVDPMCRHFVQDLVKQAMQVDFPNDIIVANIEGIHTPHPADRMAPHDLESMLPASTSHWQQLIEDQIKAISEATSDMKSAEEARKICIKFISMETYFEEYDWSGVFTEEDMEEWYTPESMRRRVAAEAQLLARAEM